MMNTVKRFWALCLDTHMKLALYKYAIIIIIINIIYRSVIWLDLFCFFQYLVLYFSIS